MHSDKGQIYRRVVAVPADELRDGGALGCMGGESSVAYEYAKEVGIVTGGKLGDNETCAPYPFEACHHPCTVFETPECPTECANSNAPYGTMEEKISVERVTSCPSFDFACIAKELYNNGPVSSYAGDIYEEFYTYADGVFRESKDSKTRGSNHGGHVIKIIGWGKEQGARGGYYWIIVNSWLNWGDRGIGKVAVGEVGIGAGVESAVMRVPIALGGRVSARRRRLASLLNHTPLSPTRETFEFVRRDRLRVRARLRTDRVVSILHRLVSLPHPPLEMSQRRTTAPGGGFTETPTVSDLFILSTSAPPSAVAGVGIPPRARPGVFSAPPAARDKAPPPPRVPPYPYTPDPRP